MVHSRPLGIFEREWRSDELCGTACVHVLSFGGSHVVIASRSCIRNRTICNRLWKRLLGSITITVTDTGAHACCVGIVDLDSYGGIHSGKSCL
jgi:hypothetical protein